MRKLQEKKYVRGITLIALVVTIVILLILSGVSLNLVLGKNGLITKAKIEKQMTKVCSEKDAIQLEILLANLQKTLDSSNQYYIGEPLYDRTLENGDKWTIIVDNSTLTQYGTGYSHILKGTKIENYGETQYEWLVNYTTGEAIQIDFEYTELSYKSSLAVIDGLLLNIDATNVNNIESLGNNVTLYYFDDTVYDTIEKRTSAYNEEAKYTDVTQFAGYDRQKSNNMDDYFDSENSAFKFNGNNYIELYNENGFDFSNGFTLELYGNFEGIVNVTVINEFMGILGLWDGKYINQCNTRFGYLTGERKKLHYSLLPEYSEKAGDWEESESTPWNQQYYIEDFMNKNNYITLVFEKMNSGNFSQKIYMNGKLLDKGELTKKYYEKFLEKAKTLNYIELGRCTMTRNSNWCYAKGLCYATRLYNRALSDEEVEQNVTKNKLYRETYQK